MSTDLDTLSPADLAERWNTSAIALAHFSRKGLLAVPYTEGDGRMAFRASDVHAFEAAHAAPRPKQVG